MSTLVIRQGKTLREGWIWCEPLPGTSPPEPDEDSPINLAGYVARLQIRRRLIDEEPLVSLTSDDALTITALEGRIDVVLSNFVTEALNFSTGYWELEVESAGGDVYEIDSGRAVLKREASYA